MRFECWALGFGVWCLVSGVWCLVFGVWGLGFNVWGVRSGFWVWGFSVPKKWKGLRFGVSGSRMKDKGAGLEV